MLNQLSTLPALLANITQRTYPPNPSLTACFEELVLIFVHNLEPIISNSIDDDHLVTPRARYPVPRLGLSTVNARYVAAPVRISGTRAAPETLHNGTAQHE